MASIAWKNNINGDWDQASNWSGGVLPGSADNVTLSTLSARIVTHSTYTDVIDNLTATTDTLSITGGTLSITGAAFFDAGLTTTGGLLAFMGSKASVSGTFAGTGGQIMLGSGTAFSLSGVTNFGAAGAARTGVEIDGPGTIVTNTVSTVAETQNGNYAGLVLGDSITWTNNATVIADGYILTGDGAGLTASLVNQNGANFDLVTDNAGIFNGTGYNSSGALVSGSSIFSNAGTFAKTGSTGGTSHVHSVFTNTALITSLSGTLEFDNTLISSGTLQANGGNIVIAGGGTLGGTVSGTGTLALASATTTLVNGLVDTVSTILLDGGNLALAANQNIASSLVMTGVSSVISLSGFNLSIASATLGCGYVVGPGTLTTSGTTSLAGYNNNGFTATGFTWINTGTLDQNQSLYDDNSTGPAFINHAGAIYNIEGDFTVGLSSNGTPSSFSNAGIFAKAAGTGVSAIASPFTNTGVIEATSGTLQFNGGGQFGGTLTGPGTIAFASNTATLSAGVGIAAADLLLNGGNIALAGNTSIATPLTITGAASSLLLDGFNLTLANAAIGCGYVLGAGTLTTSGTTNVAGYNNDGFTADGLTWVNTGTLDQNQSLYDDSGAGPMFINVSGAIYTIEGDFAFGVSNDGTPSAFTNAGTFAKAAGSNTSTIYAPFNNTGVVTVQTGTVQFNGGGTFGGTLTGEGQINFGGGTSTLAAGTSLTVANLGFDGGRLVLSSPLSYTGNINMQGGSLLLATGTSNFVGGFTLANAQISLGGGTLDITNAGFGNYGNIAGPGTLALAGTTTLGSGNGAYLYVFGGCTITNSGTLNLDNPIYFYDQNGAGNTILNQSGATIDIIADTATVSQQPGADTITNAGTLEKTAGTGVSTISADFINSGLVDVATTGTLAFSGGGTIGGTLAGAGTVAFSSNTDTWAAGLSITAANVLLSGGSIVLGGNKALSAGVFTETGGVLNLNGHALTLSGANFADSYLEGGSLTTKGTTTLAYVNTVAIGSNLAWTNMGVVNQHYYTEVDNSSGAGFSIVNAVGASWNLAGDFYLGNNATSTAFSTFDNAGSFVRVSGNTYDLVYSVFTNTGTISATVGEIAFEGGGVFGGTITGTGLTSFQNNSYALGGLTEAAATTIEFYQSTFNLTSNISLNGTLIVNGNSSVTNLAGHVFSLATLDLAHAGSGLELDGAGTLATTGTGSVVDWYSNGVMVNLGGGAEWANSGTIALSGLLQLGDAALISGSAAGTLANSGVFDLNSNDANIIVGTYVNGYGTRVSSLGYVVNSGTFGKTGGTGTNTIYAAFTSTGTLATTTGVLALANGGAVSGLIADGSMIAFSAGSFADGALVVGGGATLSNAATINATSLLTLGDSNGMVAGFTNTGLYAIQANAGIGAGATAGSVITNSGTIAKLGGSGRAVISDGILNIGLIGADSGTLALTQSVTGTGALSIGAAATLELGAGIAATQGIRFISGSGTLLLDAPASAHETISGFVFGDTIDLAKLTATSAVLNASDQLLVSNGSTVVATLSLTGTHTGDVYGVGSDGHSGTDITIASSRTAWDGTSADWNTANVWTNGTPGIGSNASVSGTASGTLSLAYGEAAAAGTLALSDASATLALAGTLSVGEILVQSAGTLSFSGELLGGTLALKGGTDVWSASRGANLTGGVLDNVAVQGNIALTAAGAGLGLAGNTVLSGSGGTGASTITITGSDSGLFVEGVGTLNNATIVIGAAALDNGIFGGFAVLDAFDNSGEGGVLTLGTQTHIVQTGLYAKIFDNGGVYDGIFNSGTITASVQGGTLTFAGNQFENDGVITIGNGNALNLLSRQFVNTGTLSMSAGTVTINASSFENDGSMNVKNSLLALDCPLTGAQLAAIAAGGDTVDLSGSLDLGTAALSVGGSAPITALSLSGSISDGTVTAPGTAITFQSGALLDNVAYSGTISVGSDIPVTLEGTIAGAVIADAGGSVLFDAGTTLNKVAYDGTMALPAGDSVAIEGGLVTDGAGGTGAGTITAAGGTLQTTLYVLDTETLNNAVIDSGADGGQGLFISASEPSAGTLALGASETFNVLAGSTAGFLSIGQTTQQPLGDAIANDGLIAISAGGSFIGSAGSIGTFTNAGQIALAADAVWTTDTGTLTNMVFANASAGSITLSSGATLVTNGGGLNNAGSILLASLSVLTDQGNFSQTGTVSVGAGGVFDIEGAVALASLAGVGGAGTLGINGTLNLGAGTFSMAAAGRIQDVILDGTVQNGVVQNNAGTLGFGTQATLLNLVWEGPLTIGAGTTVQAQALTVQSATGGTPGVINLSGGGNLDYLTALSVDNVTITSSSPSAGAADPSVRDGIAFSAAGGTLTLGAHAVLDANAGATEILYTGTLTAGTELINNGKIDVSAGALWLFDPSVDSVVNNASIVMGSNTQIGANPSLGAGDSSFTNAGAVTMAAQDTFNVAGNTENVKIWSVGADGEVNVGGNLANSGTLSLGSLGVASVGGSVSNAGLLAIGAGGEVVAGALANAGRITLGHGASIVVDAAFTNTGTIVASGATPDLIAGTDAAGSSYNAGTLAGGVWQVSAASTLTLAFNSTLSTDNADIILNGAGAVLRSLGGDIVRLESSLGSIGTSGTLALLGARGYTTSLNLADSGVLQLQGGTLSAGGLQVAAGGLLTGSGSVSSAIANASVIDASGGTLTLAAAVTGAGVLNIAAASTLELAAANTEDINFQADNSALKLDAPTSFAGTLSGFGAGDTIALVSTTATAATLSGTSLTVKLSGGSTEIFKLAASAALTTLTVTSDGSGGSILSYPAAAAVRPPIVPPATRPSTPQIAPSTTEHAPAMRFLAAPTASSSGGAMHRVGIGAHAALVTRVGDDTGGTAAGWSGTTHHHPPGAGSGAWPGPVEALRVASLTDTRPTIDHLQGGLLPVWWASR